MILFKTEEEYMNYFRGALDGKGEEGKMLDEYVAEQFRKLDQLIKTISEENFWHVFPEILGIDAKLTLLVELFSFDDFSIDDVLRIVEEDYQTYYKELCGYDLKSAVKPSMIFSVA